MEVMKRYERSLLKLQSKDQQHHHDLGRRTHSRPTGSGSVSNTCLGWRAWTSVFEKHHDQPSFLCSWNVKIKFVRFNLSKRTRGKELGKTCLLKEVHIYLGGEEYNIWWQNCKTICIYLTLSWSSVLSNIKTALILLP